VTAGSPPPGAARGTPAAHHPVREQPEERERDDDHQHLDHAPHPTARPADRALAPPPPHARLWGNQRDQEETDVAGGTEEIVTSPDQHKPGPKKAAYIGAISSIVILLLMLMGNHHGKVEDLWLVAVAGLLILVLVADFVLRKNGIKRSE
jgi:hypothetical protein